MQLVPVGRRILVKMMKEEKKGIILMTKSQDEPTSCEVIEVGEKVEIPVKAGMKLLLVPYAGSKIGGTEEEPYMIINENDVVGILNG